MAFAVGRWGSALAAFGVWVSVVSSAHGEVAVSAAAARRFEEGVRYLRSQDPDRYEKAYREFKAAYADSPSWKILGNLGIVAQELERDGEAIDAYEAYLKGGGKELEPDERRQFERDLALLRSGLITLQIRTVPDGAWIVDERLPDSGASVVNRYGPAKGPLVLRVRAGHHRVRAELAGHHAESWELSEAAGATVEHVFELLSSVAPQPELAPEPTPVAAEPSGGAPWRALSYVSLGLGAVGVGLGTWFLLDIDDKDRAASAAYDACLAALPATSPERDCPVPSPSLSSPLRERSREAYDADADEDRVRTLSLAGFAAGGALLATGVVLLLVAGEDAEEGAQSARLVPWVGPTSAGITGTF